MANLLTRRQSLALGMAALRGPRPWFAGTFLQLWAAHLEWPEERWRSLFGYLGQLGTGEVIVQWCAYDRYDYTSLCVRLLALAGEHGMRMRIGLRHESSWWQDLEAAPESALARLTPRALQAVHELKPLFQRHGAFAGWYLPEEIDDAHWTAPPRTTALLDTLKSIHGAAGSFSLSGFTNRALPPRALAAWWRRVAKPAGLKSVLFQDGIGAGKLSLEDWPGYAEELQRALGARFRVVVETFESTGGAGGFQAVPAPVSRIRRQCEIARRCSGRAPIAFSLPEYCTPLGGSAAAALHEQIVHHME
ncbi:MAG: DUF4434 domain-containing protein [Acidobacteria bacterium]|nr:DUF4434 domain-containing protein [Acidobacteriota bacterium]